MESNENRPNAALINREWYESAAQVLDARKLADLCLYAVKYVLYGILPETEDRDIKLVFAMVRPALESDITKYRERCARNAANAKSQRQRVAASGSESVRVGAIPTTTTTTTTTTTSVSINETEQEEKETWEKWLIFGYFWSVGSNNIREECNAFWSYYESLGWKNNKGAAIVSKLAAARMWRRQFDTHTPVFGADAWYSVVKDITIPDVNVFTCFAGIEKGDNIAIVKLWCTESFLTSLYDTMPDIKERLRRAVRGQGIEIQRLE